MGNESPRPESDAHFRRRQKGQTHDAHVFSFGREQRLQLHLSSAFVDDSATAVEMSGVRYMRIQAWSEAPVLYMKSRHFLRPGRDGLKIARRFSAGIGVEAIAVP